MLIFSILGIRCGNPGSVANGNVIYSDDTVGSIVRVECNDGFLLNGDPERVCLSDGRWSGGLPTCEGTRCIVALKTFIFCLQQ